MVDLLERSDQVLPHIFTPLILLIERETRADHMQQFLLGLSFVVPDNLFFFCMGTIAAGQCVNRLPWHCFYLRMKNLWHLQVEFIVLKKVVGSLPVAIGCNQPCGERTLAVTLQNLLRFF